MSRTVRCERCKSKTYRCESDRRRCFRCGWFDSPPPRFFKPRFGYVIQSGCGWLNYAKPIYILIYPTPPADELTVAKA
jgi:hypothetical protein